MKIKVRFTPFYFALRSTCTIFAFGMKKLLTLYILVLSLMMIAVLPAHGGDKKLGKAVELKAKGDACYNAGRYPEALDYYTQGLDRAKSENEEKLYYACIGNIGNIYATMGDYKRALHYYMKGYEASEIKGNAEMQWRFATNIVAVYCMMGDVVNARVFFKQQMSLPGTDTTRKKYYFYNNQSLMARADGNLRMAEYYTKAALDYATDKRMPKAYVMSEIICLGDIRMEAGDAKGAMRFYAECRDSLAGGGDKAQLVSVYKKLAAAAQQLGDSAAAGHYRHRYLSLSDSVFNTAQFNIAAGKLFEYENAETKKRVDDLVSHNRIQLVIIIVFVTLAVSLALLYAALRRKNRMLTDARQTLMRKNEELTAGDRRQKKLLEQYVEALNAKDREKDNGAQADETHQERNEIGLDAEQQSRLLNSITSVLEDVETISRSDFGLNMLAEMVGTNTKYVSWLINDTYHKNFKTLLNEYRIREACRRLADSEHYGNVTIQTIYEQLGYSSASGFINAFRNVNGMTPSAYMKLVRKGGSMKG